jgi:SPW repeat
MDTRSSRYLNIIVGIWLFVSAFVWRHSAAQFTNTWVMGIIVAAVAALALTWPTIRYLNTLAGAWLIISAFALPTITAGTRWNNFIVGIVVVVLSLAGAPSIATQVRRTRAA